MEPDDVDAFEASIKKTDFLLLNNEVPEAGASRRRGSAPCGLCGRECCRRPERRTDASRGKQIPRLKNPYENRGIHIMIWSVQILLDRSRAELYGVDVGPNCRTVLLQTAKQSGYTKHRLAINGETTKSLRFGMSLFDFLHYQQGSIAHECQ